MENALGIDVSNVTYEGSADCVTAIVGGHIDATFAQPSNATAQVELATPRSSAPFPTSACPLSPTCLPSQRFSPTRLIMR